jgi:hypothetical protein
MTTPGMQGEVSPESMGKTAFSAAEGSLDAKPAPSRTTGNTAEQDRLKPCRRKPFDLWKELTFGSQKGNSGSKTTVRSNCQHHFGP